MLRANNAAADSCDRGASRRGLEARDAASATLNQAELQSIYGLLAWVAHEQNVRQDVAQTVLEAEFGVNHVSKLRAADYEAIVRYLLGLRLDRRH